MSTPERLTKLRNILIELQRLTQASEASQASLHDTLQRLDTLIAIAEAERRARKVLENIENDNDWII